MAKSDNKGANLIPKIYFSRYSESCSGGIGTFGTLMANRLMNRAVESRMAGGFYN
ncbi:MAG: hypothetical protein Pg6C_13120 [Treponemataceae bacterium]|nr:MAG: hypothetical protein Pg6C_13120 [Treponemataceae bacterium]